MASPNRIQPQEIQEISIDPKKIEILAYEIWQDRGSPVGSPETDWLQAEEELRIQAEEDNEELSDEIYIDKSSHKPELDYKDND